LAASASHNILSKAGLLGSKKFKAQMAIWKTYTFGCVAVIGGGRIHSCPHQVDREKVLSHGKEVVGKLLVDLQVRKSTADGAGARQFYTQLTTPLPGWDKDIREVVLRKKTVSDLKTILPSFLKPFIPLV
jgi:hypothetical protein